jgi:hypothetical protein
MGSQGGGGGQGERIGPLLPPCRLRARRRCRAGRRHCHIPKTCRILFDLVGVVHYICAQF